MREKAGNPSLNLNYLPFDLGTATATTTATTGSDASATGAFIS
jgi:hypothetical protein